jgi:cytochrome b561
LARYHGFAIALHWIVAALLVAQFAWGWWMQEIPKQPVGPRVDAFNLHKSIGLTILALMVVRLGWRLSHPPPPLPALPRWETRLARTVHAVLYVALFVQPLAGYLGSVFSGYPVKIFGVVLPAWGWKDDAIKDLMSQVHLANSFVLAAAVALHLGGALKHLADGSGIVRRMLPAPRVKVRATVSRQLPG